MSTNLRQVPAYLIALLFLIILALLLSTNYLSALLLIVGCLLALPVGGLIYRATPTPAGIGGLTRRQWLVIGGLLLIACFAFLWLFFISGLSFNTLDDLFFVVSIKPDASEMDTFQIEGVPNTSGTQVRASPKGLFLREVTVLPGKVPPQVHAEVKLRDFPKDSFYAAKSAQNVRHTVYIDTELITWSIEDPSEGIFFAYIPYPFYFIKPIIEPFISAAYMTPWLVLLFGLMGMVLATPILRPVIFSPFLKRFGSKTSPEYTKPEQTIINVSGDLNVGRDFVGHDKTTHGDEINAQGDVNNIKHE